MAALYTAPAWLSGTLSGIKLLLPGDQVAVRQPEALVERRSVDWPLPALENRGEVVEESSREESRTVEMSREESRRVKNSREESIREEW